MIQTESAILRTLAYADVFCYPLTEQQLWRYLLGRPAKLTEFRTCLKQLLARKKILKTQEFITLRGGAKYIEKRKIRQRESRQKYRYAQRAVRLLRLIPSVWCVGISGALAMGNAPKTDDIDLLIITAPKALWVTRLLSTVILDLFGLRRRVGEREVANKICLNMYLDSKNLRLTQGERDLYSAHEIIQMKPLLNRFSTHEQFLLANIWVKKYLPQALVWPDRDKLQIKLPFWVAIIQTGEWTSKQIQLIYMRRRRTQEVIGKYMLRFHPQDAREWVMSAYQERLKRLGITAEETLDKMRARP